jgi:ABC-type uncharacterized transport system ATPase subunit
MMDIITGKTKPDEGVVLFDGVTDLTRLDETRIAELGIGRKFQKPTVFESQTIEDNLLLALNVDHSVRGTLFWRESKVETERIERVLFHHGGKVDLRVVAVIGLMLASQYVPTDIVSRLQSSISRWSVAAQASALAGALIVIDALGPTGIAPFIYFSF